MGSIFIDKSAVVHASSIITPSALDECDIFIERNVIIEPFVRILPCGGRGSIIIREESVLNVGVVLYGGGGIIIGANSLIGAYTVISATTHNYLEKNCPIKAQGHKDNCKPVDIGEDCWIGTHTFIGPQVSIARGCVFPDHSSITKSAREPYVIHDRQQHRVYVRR